MDFKEAEQILQIIRSSNLQSLSVLFLKSAVRYAQIRVEWYYSDQDERIDLDPIRMRAHEALICNCNALGRNMQESGEDYSWKSKLGDDRKRIGDFACYIHAIIGIDAR